MEKITITIKKTNWKILKELELKKDFKTHDEAIEFLLKKSRVTTLNLKSKENKDE